MKNFKILISSSLILLSINSISAQYGTNRSGLGRGNSSMDQMNQGMPEDKPEEIPVEKTIADIMDGLKPAVNLDELQVIAISNVLKESIREQGILLKQNFSEEDRNKNFTALSEVTDRKIMAFLNKDQKEKYLLFKETKNIPKKRKSKKEKK